MASASDDGTTEVDPYSALERLDGDEQVAVVQTISTLASRAALASELGQSWGDLDEREYFDTLGYPVQEELGVDEFWLKYDRGDIAQTIVEAPAEATWHQIPDVEDDDRDGDSDTTDFEADIRDLFDERDLLNAFKRLDILQRIGRYGVLFIGWADGTTDTEDFDQPVNREQLARADSPSDAVLYLQPFSERHVDFERVTDAQSEDFGGPEMYEIDFGDEHPAGTTRVHPERVLHVAEGALEDEFIGRSALRAVYNILMDILKIRGGSAEMYWRDAKKRLVANLDPEVGSVPDEDDLAAQVEEMVNDLRDVVWGRGLEIDDIPGGSPDPSGAFDVNINLLAGVVRIPKRKLLGTERGDLASSQDEAAFVQMVEERWASFAEAKIYRAFVETLRDFDVIAEPEGDSYSVDLPDLFALTEKEMGEVFALRARAVKDAASMGDPAELMSRERRLDFVFDMEPEDEDTAEPGEPGAPEDVDDPLDETDDEVGDIFDEIMGDDHPTDLDEIVDLDAALGD